MSTVECEGYVMENSQELNKYGQSVTTRQLRDCFVEQKGCLSDQN